jgi:hypothetical protein
MEVLNLNDDKKSVTVCQASQSPAAKAQVARQQRNHSFD